MREAILHPIVKNVLGNIELPAVVQDTACLFLLDTGSTASCLDLEFADQLGLDKMISDEYVAGLGGMAHRRYVAYNVPLQIGEMTIEVPEMAIFSLEHLNQALEQKGCEKVQGIIGADVLSAHKAVIDYENLTLVLKT